MSVKLKLTMENKGQHNKSMDVRAKQRLSYRVFLVNSELRVIGFAPRHLNRSVFLGCLRETI